MSIQSISNIFVELAVTYRGKKGEERYEVVQRIMQVGPVRFDYFC